MLTFDFKKINLPPRSKVLDVGCGEGRHIFGILNEFNLKAGAEGMTSAF